MSKLQDVVWRAWTGAEHLVYYLPVARIDKYNKLEIHKKISRSAADLQAVSP